LTFSQSPLGEIDFSFILLKTNMTLAILSTLMKLVKREISKPTNGLVQPAVSTLIHEIRQLTQLTQVQLAAALGVSYETINRWENGHIQPSPLAMKQIQSFVNQLSLSPSMAVQNQSKQLLTQYFVEAGQEE
jgi:putative transcriptional regulator